MMTIALALVYVASFFLVCRMFSKREGYYSTVAVFGVAAFIYYVGIPLEMTLSDAHIVSGSILNLPLTPDQLNQIVFMATVAFLSFSLGYFLSGFNPFVSSEQPPVDERNPGRYRTPTSILVLCVCSILALALFFRDEIIASSTYGGAYATRYGSSLFSFLMISAVLATAVIGGAIIAGGRMRHLLLGLAPVSAIALWAIYSSSKFVLLIAMLPLGMYLVTSRINRRFITLPLLIAIVLAGLLLFSMFNSYRGGESPSLDLHGIAPTEQDPRGIFESLTYVLHNNEHLRLGSTYLDSFYLLIPKTIWAARPLDAAERFAREVVPNWTAGQGLGFSLLAEAYVNFSWFGALIQYLMIGLLWGWFWRATRRLFFWHYPQLAWQSLYLVLGYYLLINMHRGTVAGLVKDMVLLSALFALAAVAVDVVLAPGRKRFTMADATGLPKSP